MKIIRWIGEEIRFVKNNAHMGIKWLVANIESVNGNQRSSASIQRIAHIYCSSIKRHRKKTEKAPRKPALKIKTLDDRAQEQVRFAQNHMWKP